MNLRYQGFPGPAMAGLLDDLARLRISVFRDWPYLYEGDLEYERDYLQHYAQGDAILIGAFDGGRLVGAATGMPLSDQDDDVTAAFDGSGCDMNTVFYCAESVLLSGYRGQGAGHVFFDRREDHARHLGFTHSAFCAVMRPDNHPMRPAGYRPLDPLWRARGYAPLDGAVATFHWPDIGETRESPKQLQFWIRALT